MDGVSSSSPGPNFTVERHVGRVIEARVFSLRTSADVDAYRDALRVAILHAPQPRIFICADHRAVPIYPPEAAAHLVKMFTGFNPRLENAGLLVSPTNAIMVMQIERIVREAGDTKRRVFTRAPDWYTFLAEKMTDEERAQLRAFQHATPSQLSTGTHAAHSPASPSPFPAAAPVRPGLPSPLPDAPVRPGSHRGSH